MPKMISEPAVDGDTGEKLMMINHKTGRQFQRARRYTDPERHGVRVLQSVYNELVKRGERAHWDPAKIEPINYEDPNEPKANRIRRAVTIAKNHHMRWVRPTEQGGEDGQSKLEELIDGIKEAVGKAKIDVSKAKREVWENLRTLPENALIATLKTGGIDEYLIMLAEDERVAQKLKDFAYDRSQARLDEVDAKDKNLKKRATPPKKAKRATKRPKPDNDVKQED